MVMGGRLVLLLIGAALVIGTGTVTQSIIVPYIVDRSMNSAAPLGFFYYKTNLAAIILCLPFGLLIDRFGIRRILVAALLVWGAGLRVIGRPDKKGC